MKYKYTKELIQRAVDDSKSIADMIRFFGLSVTGGNHGNMKQRIVQYNIDISHFKPGGFTTENQSKKRKTAKDILIKGSENKREYPHLLRRALIEIGRNHVCESCDCGTVWKNIPLTLQIDHIDGDYSNNHPDNLRFLCPNCHSQTPTFGNKKKPKCCKLCGEEFYPNHKTHTFCSTICSNKSKSSVRLKKIVWPSDSDLKKMVNETNFSVVGKSLGVSDNAVRKHLKIGERLSPNGNVTQR